MDTIMLNLLGCRLHEYLLIIEPSSQTQKELQAFKRYFTMCHQYPNAIVSKSHITLLRFLQYESYEKRIVHRLQQLADLAMPFNVELAGFGSFGHTLYVDIKSTRPILELVSTYRQGLRPWIYGMKGSSPYYVTKPHITIARNLTPSQGETVWPIWRNTRYCSSFQAKNMTLLKRLVGTHSYSVVRKFNFLGLLPPVVQGKLFA